MQDKKRKCDLPPKMRIHLTINNEVKQSKIHHANTMAQTMGNTHLDLRYYARLHATIHCRSSQQYNVMCNPLVTTILTQYHVSKRLKVSSVAVVEAVLKDLNNLHDRIVMDPKNSDEMYKFQKKAALQYLIFLYLNICGKLNGRGCADRINQSK